MSLIQTYTEAVDLDVLTSYDEAQIEGEPDFVVELIDLYLFEVPGLLASLREALDKKDRTTARRLAHTLRGSSGNLGVLQFAAIANKLEHLSAADYETPAKELVLSLEIEFDRARDVLLAERERRS